MIAKQVDNAIKKGTLHFKALTYEYLPDVKSVLEALNTDGTFISWHKNYQDGVIGLHSLEHGNVLIPIPKELKQVIDKIRGGVSNDS